MRAPLAFHPVRPATDALATVVKEAIAGSKIVDLCARGDALITECAPNVGDQNPCSFSCHSARAGVFDQSTRHTAGGAAIAERAAESYAAVGAAGLWARCLRARP